MEERELLRRELAAIFDEYLAAGRTITVQRAAARVYAAWHNASPILDEEAARCVHALVDLASTLGCNRIATGLKVSGVACAHRDARYAVHWSSAAAHRSLVHVFGLLQDDRDSESFIGDSVITGRLHCHANVGECLH